MSPEAIRSEGKFPCIIHWNMNHFVVLNGFRGDNAYINDPARGTVKVSWKEFDESFTGVVLIPEPGENFSSGGRRRSTVEFAKNGLPAREQLWRLLCLQLPLHIFSVS